ncbi:hypothetical protein BGX24_004269 [Mortierella sp. AD032]|nr:hypothetical protein BGX24_004269 [Mortierella sp. AD032]
MKTHLSTTTSQPQTSADFTSTSPPSSSQSTFSDWKPAPTSSSSTATTFSAIDTVVPKTEPDTTTNYVDIAGQVESLEQPDIKPIVDAMVPSQSQAPTQPVYPSAYYTSSEFVQAKSLPSQFNSTQYMAQGTYTGGHPYAPAVQPAIHRRPSLMVGQQKHHAVFPHSPPDSRSRTDYSTQLTADNNNHQSALDLSHSPIQAGLQDTHGRHGSLDSAVHHHLPPLTETLQRIDHSSPRSRPQPSATNIDGTISSSNYYPQVPLPGAPSAVGSNVPVNQAYSRRVTYPFVPSIDTSSGLLMNSLTSPENSGSSPLLGSPFAHSSVISSNAVPSVHGMVRSSPLIGYMDAMSLHSSSQPHPSSQMSPHNGVYPPPLQQVAGTPQQPQGAWFPDATGLDGIDNCQGGNKIYSFVPISGVNSKKRPRRRFDEIERLYVCNWADCEKSYGTLNHLNAHVTMQKHGPKRNPAEFKELRKAWRRQKKAEEEAAKQAAAFQNQHNQQQQGNQLQICDPVMGNLHPHPLAMQAMSQQQHQHHQQQHQPHQLPHPHEHPNQYQSTHHHQQQHHHTQGQPQQHLQHPHQHQHHHHPMGF